MIQGSQENLKFLEPIRNDPRGQTPNSKSKYGLDAALNLDSD